MSIPAIHSAPMRLMATVSAARGTHEAKSFAAAAHAAQVNVSTTAPGLPSAPPSVIAATAATSAPTQGRSTAGPTRPPGISPDYVYRDQMWLPPKAAAIYDAQKIDEQQHADQIAFWMSSTNPAQIEGLPLEQWNATQLQNGLAFYGEQLAKAVPDSNEWRELTDRINSIQTNLDGNRSPWNYALSSTGDYWSTIVQRQAPTPT